MNMKNTFRDLIEQSYYFPQEGFNLKDGYLNFHGVSLKYLIQKYETPFKLIYLPRIGAQIQKAQNLFKRTIRKHKYKGKYNYCYCTKCSHFSHVVKTTLREGVHLETSSSFDIDLIYRLYEEGELNKKIFIVHNGHKTNDYLKKIILLNENGFKNSILVLDSASELMNLKELKKNFKGVIKIGIRMAIDEAPKSPYYTSRLGIRPSEVVDVYNNQIKGDKSLSLKMFHFFIDSGIKDNMYYWGEFNKALNQFISLKQIAPELESFNLGGGLPIRNNLCFEYDYEHMINEIVKKIKSACSDSNIEEPDIFTEFGKFTVGESGAIIFSVLEQKQQNDTETWYMVDNSLMNTIPDAWSICEKFILLPINKWDNEYQRVNIGGISCDHSDYYNSEDLNQQILLPTFDKEDKDSLYIGFFHTGAYQDSISGYGGIKHCLIPSPKLIIIDRDETGNFVDTVYRNEQTVDEMLSILGYKTDLPKV